MTRSGLKSSVQLESYYVLNMELAWSCLRHVVDVRIIATVILGHIFDVEILVTVT